MKIYIENMEMPKCCEECKLEYDNLTCIITDQPTAYDKRRDDCPLRVENFKDRLLLEYDIINV